MQTLRHTHEEFTKRSVLYKTGLVKRFMQRTPHLERIEAAADELRRLNDRRYEDSRIAELVTVIEQETAALKE